MLGTQEAERSIAKSVFVPNKKSTIDIIEQYFELKSKNTEYAIISSVVLASTFLIVVCRKSLLKHINNIQSDTLTLGLADKVPNKGAVCISFNVGRVRQCFINCHLHAFQNQVERRDA